MTASQLELMQPVCVPSFLLPTMQHELAYSWSISTGSEMEFLKYSYKVRAGSEISAFLYLFDAYLLNTSTMCQAHIYALKTQ